MKDTKLESISGGLFNIVEPNDCLTATGGNTIATTIKITHVANHPDVLEDVRAD
ncbi:MAG TPA: hypothetical protein VEZ90_17910 [Blastocatellia bacterium]|nr:hypothetical protein [Blastocatellia bacterium]